MNAYTPVEYACIYAFFFTGLAVILLTRGKAPKRRHEPPARPTLRARLPLLDPVEHRPVPRTIRAGTDDELGLYGEDDHEP